MRLLVAGLVVLTVLVVADRVAAAWAGGRLGDRLAQTESLDRPPDVRIGGFPFLAQALSGRYDRIEVEATGLVLEGGLRVDRLSAVLAGVRLPLREAAGGGVGRVPVERVGTEALLAFDDLEQRMGSAAAESLELAAVEDTPGSVRIEAVVGLLGREVPVAAEGAVSVEGEDLVVRAGRIRFGDSAGVSGAAESALNRVADDLDLRVPLDDLPFGLIVRDVRVTREGLVILADGQDVVLEGGAAGRR